MTTISATTVLRSRHAQRPDVVLSTLLLRYPRWIHAEQRTHRVIPLDEGLAFEQPTPSPMADPNLSRNAASSRAIPVKKMIEDVLRDPAVPLFWGKNQPGMQAHEECNEPILLDGYPEYYDSGVAVSREKAWLLARDKAVEFARAFAEAGYHKQIVNRLLEPFSHITVLCSATEWSNFLELRDHPDAEPHIRMLAQAVRKCLEDESTIQTLEPGAWHLPFVEFDPEGEDDEWRAFEHLGLVRETTFQGKPALTAGSPGGILPEEWEAVLEALIKLSVARCASTSYKTVDGFDMTLERATALYDKLVSSRPIHASPAEHVAQADDVAAAPWGDTSGKTFWENPEQHGNFVGFRQHRHMLPPG